jgi:spore photoproduct lyase
MTFKPEIIYIENGAEEYELTQNLLQQFPETPVVRNAESEVVIKTIKQNTSDWFGASKRHLFLSRFKGTFLKKCPGLSPGMVCCNYLVVNLMKNCMYDCSYCFLQDFLRNNPLFVAYVNIDDLILELEETFRNAPAGQEFRVGTGELTDSLALDDIVPYTKTLIPFFNKQKNATLELKTKSDRVENLLAQDDPTNVVVSWSLNPREIVEAEEKGTPSLEQKLQSARQCQEKGYRIGIHLDPIILFPGWEKIYKDLIEEIFLNLDPKNIEWVSLGSFRYRSGLKQAIKERNPKTQLFSSEHMAGRDGKYRYLRPLRNHAYETIRNWVKAKDPNLSAYLCMETKEIWEGATGAMPKTDPNLEDFFSPTPRLG